MGKWQDLTAKLKVEVIKFAILNGVSNISDIRDTFNMYANEGKKSSIIDRPRDIDEAIEVSRDTPYNKNIDDVEGPGYREYMWKLAQAKSKVWGISPEEAYDSFIHPSEFNYRRWYNLASQDELDNTLTNGDVHWMDVFGKTVDADTFSNESPYSGYKNPYNPKGITGGTWTGRLGIDEYIPSDSQIDNNWPLNKAWFAIDRGNRYYQEKISKGEPTHEVPSIMTYNNGVMLPEITVTPKGNYIEYAPLYKNGGHLGHWKDGTLEGEDQHLQRLDNTYVATSLVEPVPLPQEMLLSKEQFAKFNHAKSLYENEGLNIVSPEFDLLTLFRGLATEPLKIFKTRSKTSSKALKDNSGLIKLLESVKGHYPDNYNYEAANQLLLKLKEEGYNLEGIDVDKLILARLENLIDANLNSRLLLHVNDGLITAHDIGTLNGLDPDIYYTTTNLINKKEGVGNVGNIKYFKDRDGSYHIKMIKSNKPNTLVGRDLYDAIELAAIENGVDNTIVAETLLLPEKTVHTMETWFPSKEIVSNEGSWDLLDIVTGDRIRKGGMPVWKLHRERPSNLKSLIFDPSIVDENGIMHLGEGMYYSTGGPLYPFSFEKNPFLKTPVVRYDEGGQTYTVKKGDTFSLIALNVGVSVLDLQKLNPTITNVNRIREGLSINIPPYIFSEIFNTPQPTGLYIPKILKTQPLQIQQQNTPILSVVVPTEKGLKTAGPLDLQELAVRQAYTESRLSPEIVNNKGAYGLFQIMLPALDDYNRINKTKYTLADMKNADNNIKVRNWYMNYLSNLGFIDKGDIQSDSVGMYKVLASFNAGAGHVKDALTKAKADGKDIYDSWDWVSYLWDEPREYSDFILRGIETKGTNKNDSAYKAVSTAKSSTANKIRSSVKL